MDYNESVVVPASTGINLPITLITPKIESNSSSKFAANDTRKDLVEEIKLQSMVLDLTSPNDEDFSFLESIEIFLSAEGLNEIKIAWKTNITSTSNQLNLQTSDKDLKAYLKKDEFTLKVTTVTDEALSRDHHIDINSVFWVDAKVLGQ